jgi:hypothetical protein
LSKASDKDVIDMLHYSGLLVSGLHQLAVTHPELASARVHMGRNCERLLREAIFTRNLLSSNDPELAQCLLDGLLGALPHFSNANMGMAISNLLEIAWQINLGHQGLVHPITKGFISFISSIVAFSTTGRRSPWVKRNKENFDSTPEKERHFQLLMAYYFTQAFSSLVNQEEDDLLRYMSLLDELLAPSIGSTSSPSPQHSSSSSSSSHSSSPFDGHQSDHSGLTSSTLSSSNSQSLEPIYSNPPEYSFYHPIPTDDIDRHHHHHDHSTSSKGTHIGESHHSNQYSSQHAPLAHPQSHHQSQDFLAASPSEDAFYTPPESLQLIDETLNPTFEEMAPYDEPGSELEKHEMSKALLRVALQLLRAEAALIFSDYSTCIYWVDEAERTLKSVPLLFKAHRVFIMKGLFKSTCPFDSGTRTVTEEFDRRMMNHDIEIWNQAESEVIQPQSLY